MRGGSRWLLNGLNVVGGPTPLHVCIGGTGKRGAEAQDEGSLQGGNSFQWSLAAGGRVQELDEVEGPMRKETLGRSAVAGKAAQKDHSRFQSSPGQAMPDFLKEFSENSGGCARRAL